MARRPCACRIEDSNGLSDTHERTITVDPAPKPAPGVLSPFPKIRLNGEILARGTRVRILSVQAPSGALVRVACRGKGCAKQQRRKRTKGRTVRFRGYERFLRAGVRLEIFIRKGDTIGRYTRYTIRAGKGPRSVDRCLYPGVKRPRACPVDAPGQAARPGLAFEPMAEQRGQAAQAADRVRAILEAAEQSAERIRADAEQDVARTREALGAVEARAEELQRRLDELSAGVREAIAALEDEVARLSPSPASAVGPRRRVAAPRPTTS